VGGSPTRPRRLPGGGLNIAYEAVDRHVLAGRGNGVAFTWLAKDWVRREFTYSDLHEQTNRFAAVLRGLGVANGDAVFGLMGRIPELYITALGSLKNGSVFSPLFSAFGPEPIRQRLLIGNGPRAGHDLLPLRTQGRGDPRAAAEPRTRPACAPG